MEEGYLFFMKPEQKFKMFRISRSMNELNAQEMHRIEHERTFNIVKVNPQDDNPNRTNVWSYSQTVAFAFSIVTALSYGEFIH